MKKGFILALSLTMVLPAVAQDTYESARLLGNDLNGTARYVGMGGAMEALGADISTISSNPAGIGLFRHSTASLSFGIVSQQDVQKFDGLNKTNMSFDQVGFVYACRCIVDERQRKLVLHIQIPISNQSTLITFLYFTYK